MGMKHIKNTERRKRKTKRKNNPTQPTKNKTKISDYDQGWQDGELEKKNYGAFVLQETLLL